MNKEELKELIEIEINRSQPSFEELRNSIFRLIDIYDRNVKSNPYGKVINTHTKAGKVPYWTKCSCNPENGGNGICGCVMANQMVDEDYTLRTNLSNGSDFTVNG